MKKLVLIAVAVSSLFMVACGGDGCTWMDTKCSGDNIMVCQIEDFNDDVEDGTWEVSQECTDGETCVYDLLNEYYHCD